MDLISGLQESEAKSSCRQLSARSVPGLALLVLLSMAFFSAHSAADAKGPPFCPTITTWGGSGDEITNGLAVDSSDGSSYLTGLTYSYGTNGEVFVVKIDACGKPVWERTWGKAGLDVGTGVAVAGKGNVYVTGFTESFGGSPQIFLLDYDASNGKLLSQFLYSGPTQAVANDIALDKSGNIYLTGFTLSPTSSHADALIVKIAPNGTIIWQYEFAGSSPEVGNRLTISPAGDIFVVGSTSDYSSQGSSLILKFSLDGAILPLPFRAYATGTFNEALGVTADSNYVYVVGRITAPSWVGCPQGGCLDALILKLDSNLVPKKALLWGGTGPDVADDVAVDEKGNFYVVGKTRSFDPYGQSDGFFYLKFDPSPILSYDLVAGTLDNDMASRVSLPTQPYPLHVAGTIGDPDNLVSQVRKHPNVGSLSYAMVTANLHDEAVRLSSSPVIGDEGFPLGSTTYGGGSDAFDWFASAIPQKAVAFNPIPPLFGLLNFDGRNYSALSVDQFTEGLYVATAIPNAGYRFSGWTSSGGVFLPDDVMANPTNVTLNDTGTLTANFQPIGLPSLSPEAALIVGVGIGVATPLIRRRFSKGGK